VLLHTCCAVTQSVFIISKQGAKFFLLRQQKRTLSQKADVKLDSSPKRRVQILVDKAWQSGVWFFFSGVL